MPIPAAPPRILFRDLQLDTAAANAEERRIPAVLSTEYAVNRGDYQEVLVHRPNSVDLTRVPLPLCEQHDRGVLNIGLVENIQLDGQTLRGEVVLGQSARASELWPDIERGIVRSLSIGYQILAYKWAGEILQVTQWQPVEVSLVSVPADPGAGLYRSFPMPTPSPSPNATAPHADEVRSAERGRIVEIQSLGDRFGTRVPDVGTLVARAIADGESADQFRARLIDALANVDNEAGGHLNRFSDVVIPRASGSRDFIAAASDAILIRSGTRIERPHPAANDFRGMSVMDLARTCVNRSGRAFSGESGEVIIRAAMGTSDFPALLGDVLWKSLRQGVESEQASHRNWCLVTQADDFRTQSRVILGSAPDLKHVDELGEYENGPLEEDRNTLVPEKFGRLVSLSWESILADNLGAFAGVGRSLGQAAMRAEADAIYGALVSNALAGPTLADGNALFAAARNNTVSVSTGTGKPLTAAALGAARAKLRRQTNVGGGLLNLVPKVLIVPPEREMEAEILVASSTVVVGTASAEAKTPGWIGGLLIVAEPRLTSTDTFYLVAGSDMIGTGEIAIVANGPDIEEIEEKKRDALTWKVRHAFAAGFVDFRGIVRATLAT